MWPKEADHTFGFTTVPSDAVTHRERNFELYETYIHF